MTRMQRMFIFLMMAMAFFSGCTPKAVSPVYFIPKDISMLPAPLVAHDFAVYVTLEKDNVEEYITANNFQVALTESIKRANLFGADTTSPYELRANVYKAILPSAGLTMTSDLCARYTLNKNNENVWSKDICYTGEATFSEAVFGATRSLMAFNRANHGHVTLLITSLREYMVGVKNMGK